jgi:hypothetical protein
MYVEAKEMRREDGNEILAKIQIQESHGIISNVPSDIVKTLAIVHYSKCL